MSGKLKFQSYKLLTLAKGEKTGVIIHSNCYT